MSNLLSKQTAARVLRPMLRPSQDDFANVAGRPPELDSSEFGRAFDAHDGRVCNKWLHYLPVYDRVFGPLRGQPVRFLEIGVASGGSLQLWRTYLGPDATIHGLDVDERCASLTTEDLPVHVGSQDDGAFLTRVVDQMGGLDVVLDDGSHVARHQRSTFDVLFPLLPDGGLYVIEDTHTSYWFRHGGGWRRPGTAIQTAKSLVDGMHKWYYRVPVGRRARVAKTEIGSVTFFDSIIVIEKASRSRPIVDRRGGD